MNRTEGLSWSQWLPALIDWMASLGKPLAIGLPLLALTLAAIGYLLVDTAWKLYVRLAWQKRCQRKPS